MPQPLHLPSNSRSTHCTGGWEGPRVWKISSLPRFNPWTIQPIAGHYTNHTTWPMHTENTWAVQKVSDLWSAKIQLFILTSETLIPFKVVSLVMHTLLPAVLSLLETFLESSYGILYSWAVAFRIMSSLDSNQVAFSGIFNLWNIQKSQGAMPGE